MRTVETVIKLHLSEALGMHGQKLVMLGMIYILNAEEIF